MGLSLTKLASDNFTRANESPLNSANWTVEANGGLQVVSNLCEPVNPNFASEQYTGTSIPNDQYASVKISLLGAYLSVGVRLSGDTGYFLNLYSDGWYVTAGTGGGGYTVSSGSTVPQVGDTWTLAAVGTTVYVLQNGNQLSSVSASYYSSGQSALAINANPITSTKASYFETGSASVSSTYSISGNAGVAAATVSYSGTASGSVTADGSGNYSISGLANGSYTITPSLSGYTFSPTSQSETVNGANITGVNFTATASGDPSNLPFLGSVTEVASVPSGQPSIFLGTVKVVASVPNQQWGLTNPYLGHVAVGSPSGSQSNPTLGEVVVVETPPAGPLDPWLGIVETE